MTRLYCLSLSEANPGLHQQSKGQLHAVYQITQHSGSGHILQYSVGLDSTTAQSLGFYSWGKWDLAGGIGASQTPATVTWPLRGDSEPGSTALSMTARSALHMVLPEDHISVAYGHVRHSKYKVAYICKETNGETTPDALRQRLTCCNNYR